MDEAPPERLKKKAGNTELQKALLLTWLKQFFIVSFKNMVYLKTVPQGGSESAVAKDSFIVLKINN